MTMTYEVSRNFVADLLPRRGKKSDKNMRRKHNLPFFQDKNVDFYLSSTKIDQKDTNSKNVLKPKFFSIFTVILRHMAYVRNICEFELKMIVSKNIFEFCFLQNGWVI